MDLLRRKAIWPVWGNMIGGELNTDTRLPANLDGVPAVGPIDLATKDPSPEDTLGLKVCCIEAHYLVPDFHLRTLVVLIVQVLVAE